MSIFLYTPGHEGLGSRRQDLKRIETSNALEEDAQPPFRRL
jgi:hypothetical protein